MLRRCLSLHETGKSLILNFTPRFKRELILWDRNVGRIETVLKYCKERPVEEVINVLLEHSNRFRLHPVVHLVLEYYHSDSIGLTSSTVCSKQQISQLRKIIKKFSKSIPTHIISRCYDGIISSMGRCDSPYSNVEIDCLVKEMHQSGIIPSSKSLLWFSKVISQTIFMSYCLEYKWVLTNKIYPLLINKAYQTGDVKSCFDIIKHALDVKKIDFSYVLVEMIKTKEELTLWISNQNSNEINNKAVRIAMRIALQISDYESATKLFYLSSKKSVEIISNYLIISAVVGKDPNHVIKEYYDDLTEISKKQITKNLSTNTNKTVKALASTLTSSEDVNLSPAVVESAMENQSAEIVCKNEDVLRIENALQTSPMDKKYLKNIQLQLLSDKNSQPLPVAICIKLSSAGILLKETVLKVATQLCHGNQIIDICELLLGTNHENRSHVPLSLCICTICDAAVSGITLKVLFKILKSISLFTSRLPIKSDAYDKVVFLLQSDGVLQLFKKGIKNSDEASEIVRILVVLKNDVKRENVGRIIFECLYGIVDGNDDDNKLSPDDMIILLEAAMFHSAQRLVICRLLVDLISKTLLESDTIFLKDVSSHLLYVLGKTMLLTNSNNTQRRTVNSVVETFTSDKQLLHNVSAVSLLFLQSTSCVKGAESSKTASYLLKFFFADSISHHVQEQAVMLFASLRLAQDGIITSSDMKEAIKITEHTSLEYLERTTVSISHIAMLCCVFAVGKHLPSPFLFSAVEHQLRDVSLQNDSRAVAAYTKHVVGIFVACASFCQPMPRFANNAVFDVIKKAFSKALPVQGSFDVQLVGMVMTALNYLPISRCRDEFSAVMSEIINNTILRSPSEFQDTHDHQSLLPILVALRKLQKKNSNIVLFGDQLIEVILSFASTLSFNDFVICLYCVREDVSMKAVTVLMTKLSDVHTISGSLFKMCCQILSEVNSTEVVVVKCYNAIVDLSATLSMDDFAKSVVIMTTVGMEQHVSCKLTTLISEKLRNISKGDTCTEETICILLWCLSTLDPKKGNKYCSVLINEVRFLSLNPSNQVLLLLSSVISSAFVVGKKSLYDVRGKAHHLTPIYKYVLSWCFTQLKVEKFIWSGVGAFKGIDPTSHKIGLKLFVFDDEPISVPDPCQTYIDKYSY